MSKAKKRTLYYGLNLRVIYRNKIVINSRILFRFHYHSVKYIRAHLCVICTSTKIVLKHVLEKKPEYFSCQ